LNAVVLASREVSSEFSFLMVESYVTAAYQSTVSTFFANPAFALTHPITDIFAGINSSNVLMFIVAQLPGAVSATFVFNRLLDEKRNV
jgi:glycerol uptake facilitator-like aquaporin